LNIEKSVRSLKIPHLIIHGESDPTVLIKEAEDLHKWNPNSELYIVNDADHVFGGSHPSILEELPADLQEVVDKTMDFISR
jgi:pimeloyl-ACP methyl ester carboxylesterase